MTTESPQLTNEQVVALGTRVAMRVGLRYVEERLCRPGAAEVGARLGEIATAVTAELLAGVVVSEIQVVLLTTTVAAAFLGMLHERLTALEATYSAAIGLISEKSQALEQLQKLCQARP